VFQLPLLAERGLLNERARDHGALRNRGALCIAPDGAVLLAEVRHDSSGALAAVLIEAGCELVAELDRGSHHPAFIDRRGTAQSPRDTYETSVLFALERSMDPAVRVWGG